MQAAAELAADLERQIAEATSRVRLLTPSRGRSARAERGALTRSPSSALPQIDEFVASQSAALTLAQQEHDAQMREMEAKIARLKAEHAALGVRDATTQGRAWAAAAGGASACARCGGRR